ncbi:hypothetical protein [Burkholderia gladioli]|uniref:hypothetical protein n=1 Tax=Burkholderia gladioli TaxID=28095 RepID=UPI0016414A2A|nr:hypothetical protein [Burkholderia gladioli]
MERWLSGADSATARPVMQTWHVSIRGLSLTTFLVDVYDDHTWRLARVGLQRLGDFHLVELARGGPSADLEADLRVAAARLARHVDRALRFAS